MSQIRNLLEPTPEVRNLLKKIRTTSTLECSKEANFSKFFVAGCVSSLLFYVYILTNCFSQRKLILYCYSYFSCGMKRTVI